MEAEVLAAQVAMLEATVEAKASECAVFVRSYECGKGAGGEG